MNPLYYGMLIIVWLFFATAVYPLFVKKVIERFWKDPEKVKEATKISHGLLTDALESTFNAVRNDYLESSKAITNSIEKYLNVHIGGLKDDVSRDHYAVREYISDSMTALEDRLSEGLQIDPAAIAEPLKISMIASLNGWWSARLKDAEKQMNVIQEQGIEQAASAMDPQTMLIAKLSEKNEVAGALLAYLSMQQQTSPEQSGEYPPRRSYPGRY